ncbi:tRNA adenosine(34) deaminase TadA [Alteromonas sp. LMIT006]|jgi:tRNA(adenine34) deaminase|uniref:tRNA adenosine(34) deaminase TadA n=1 Tax=Alteromonadaceae TaxID=72275 RepID=UPI0020CA7F96|nr:tRNA adenosine(34) deaminase TadA [Alteromonas sp. LMIT006]UTP72576.1 tRNA adenosine(34) deaminase TadA [Alteromonas sp. LMIT006]
MNELDEQFMQHALSLADHAEAIGEVPVGACIVHDGNIVGEGWNRSITNNDPCGHAEIQAIQNAAKNLGNYRLVDCTLYVTLEPCAMCSGAIVHARIKRVVVAATDPKTGCAGSILNLLQHPDLNHKCELTIGVRQAPASQKISNFFRKRREQNKAEKLAAKATQNELS